MSADVKGGHTPGRLAAASELLARGEFSSLAHNNGRNALAAADAVLTLVGFDDLLEALKNAKGLIDTPIGRRRHDGDPFYADVVASLRSALAKAEGPSS